MRFARARALLLVGSMLLAAGCCRGSGASSKGETGTSSDAAAEWLVIPNTLVQLKAPSGWSRAKRGDWGLLGSPDKNAVLAFVEYDRPSDSTANLSQVASVLETSNIKWTNPKAITIGPDSFSAMAADGTCHYPSGDGVISSATVNPREGKHVLVVYAFNKDASEPVRRQALDTVGSMRKKR